MDSVRLKTTLICECGEIIRGAVINRPQPYKMGIMHPTIIPAHCPKCKKRIEAVDGPTVSEDKITYA